MNMSETTGDKCSNAKKITRCQVLVFLGDDNGKDFSIDKGDYLAIREILSDYTAGGSDRWIQKSVKVQENDERRVYKLKLYKQAKLSKLPEEIGDLTGLSILILAHSEITSLPTSIGRLKNLRVLDLSYIDTLSELPEEIGDLTSLNKLNLASSGIASIPPSIGQLRIFKFWISI